MTLHLVTAAQAEDHISSSDDARLYEALVGSGGIVFDHGNKMAASMTDPNTMRIMDGAALLCGRYWNITNYEEVTITNGTPGMNSIALVVANVKTDPSETVTLKVYEGVETEGDPVMPSYIEGNLNAGDTEAEMPLYAVRKTGLSVGDPEQQFEVFLSEKKFRSSIVQIEEVTVNENISPKAQVYILIPAKAGYEIFSCALKITEATGAANALLLSQPMSSNGNLFTRIYNTADNTVGLNGTVVCYYIKL